VCGAPQRRASRTMTTLDALQMRRASGAYCQGILVTFY
jgi:hypothetical protein